MLYGQLDEFRNLSGCDDLVIDSEVHRYGDKKVKWYVLHDLDYALVGVYGDWRTGEINKWVSSKSGESFTSAQNTDLKRKMEESRQKALAEKKRVNDQVAAETKALWAECKKDGFVHKYLADKKVKAYGIGWHKGELIIPLVNKDGELRSYQAIGSSGFKRFPEGGEAKGMFYLIPGSPAGLEKTFICEGYATGATIHEATGAEVVIALFANNLPAVAKHFPNAVVACDNDQFKPDRGNAGVEYGKKTGLECVIPQFKDLSTEPTDFNDLMALEGIGAVRDQLQYKFQGFEQEDLTGWKHEVITKKFIIKGMLKERHSLIIAGKGGVGKSMMLLEWALRLGMDKPIVGPVNTLLGRFEIPEPKRCLFLQSENDREDTIERYQKMIAYAPELEKGAKNVRFLKRDGDIVITGFYFTAPDFKARIIEEIHKFKADILVIDPLISFHEEDENDNGAMRRSLDILTEIQHELGISIIMIHHASKAASSKDSVVLRGASSISDWVGNILFLEEVKGRTLKLVYPKHRGCPGFMPIYLKITEGLTFEVTENPERTDKERRMDMVIEALRELGGVAESQTQILVWLQETYPDEKFNKNNVSNFLKEMENEGTICFGKRGAKNRTEICLDIE